MHKAKRSAITVEINSVGEPRLTYRGDVSGERLATAAPEGYAVQWAGPIVRLGRGRFALPLVRVQS